MFPVFIGCRLIDRRKEEREMTPIELQLCDMQGGLYKPSIRRGIGSVKFIKAFMKSITAKAFIERLKEHNLT